MKITKKQKSFLRKQWEILFLEIIKKRISKITLESKQVLIIDDPIILEDLLIKRSIDQNIKLVIISIPLNNFENLVEFFYKINNIFPDETKIVVNYYSILWTPIFYFFSKIGLINSLKKNECLFSKRILEIFLQSTNYRISHYINEPLIPFNIFGLTKFLQIVTNIFTFLNFFSFTKICYLQKRNISENFRKKKASIIIPCKNEENNIQKLFEDTNKLEFPYELVFIDDQSNDSTLEKINHQINLNTDKEVKVIKGNGLGKYQAVKLGIKEASGYYSMIFDADITVDMTDLNLFYKAIAEGRGNLINGSRLIYKPYAGAMKTLNYYGNIFFAILVSYITNSKVSDTLCGTKCFRTSDIEKFDEFENKNKILDLWGDFNILFASAFYGSKTIDLPIRYKKREEGETKMNKRFFFFKNMLRTCFKAFIRFKIL